MLVVNSATVDGRTLIAEEQRWRIEVSDEVKCPVVATPWASAYNWAVEISIVQKLQAVTFHHQKLKLPPHYTSRTLNFIVPRYSQIFLATSRCPGGLPYSY